MYLFPLQMRFVKRLTFLILISDTDDGQNVQLVRNIEKSSHILRGVRIVFHLPVAYLAPTTAQSQIFSLQLHIDGGNRSIFYPNIAFHYIRQYNNSQRAIFQPAKNRPGTFLLIMVPGVISSTSTPPRVTMASSIGLVPTT